jgi:hypothetical protein
MKLFAKNVLFLMLSAMRMQPTTFTLTVIASVLVFTARADDRLTQLQHQFELPRFQSLSLTPLPPPSLDENTLFQSSSFVLALVDTPVQPVASPLAADSSTAGATMLEAIRVDDATGPLQLPIAPPPDFQIQLNQAGIQPVPEPSIFALGGLAVGLTALRRLKLNTSSCENK